MHLEPATGLGNTRRCHPEDSKTSHLKFEQLALVSARHQKCIPDQLSSLERLAWFLYRSHFLKPKKLRMRGDGTVPSISMTGPTLFGDDGGQLLDFIGFAELSTTVIAVTSYPLYHPHHCSMHATELLRA